MKKKEPEYCERTLLAWNWDNLKEYEEWFMDHIRNIPGAIIGLQDYKDWSGHHVSACRMRPEQIAVPKDHYEHWDYRILEDGDLEFFASHHDGYYWVRYREINRSLDEFDLEELRRIREDELSYEDGLAIISYISESLQKYF